MAVFVPVAFFPGSMTDEQFALTIAFSAAISTFFAITLTPALSFDVTSRQRPCGWAGSFDQIR